MDKIDINDLVGSNTQNTKIFAEKINEIVDKLNVIENMIGSPTLKDYWEKKLKVTGQDNGRFIKRE